MVRLLHMTFKIEKLSKAVIDTVPIPLVNLAIVCMLNTFIKQLLMNQSIQKTDKNTNYY